MVNAKGGFAYIDMSVYGAFTVDTPKTVDLSIGDTLNKIEQTGKPVIITGLQIDDSGTVTTIPTAFVAFLATGAGSYVATISGGNTYINITIYPDDNAINVDIAT